MNNKLYTVRTIAEYGIDSNLFELIIKSQKFLENENIFLQSTIIGKNVPNQTELVISCLDVSNTDYLITSILDHISKDERDNITLSLIQLFSALCDASDSGFDEILIFIK